MKDPDPTDHLHADEHAAEQLAPDLSGDMGVSSERVDPTGGVQGTGTTGPAQGRTSGMAPTYPDEEIPTPRTTTPGMPEDELEENPAEVPPHPFDTSRNPGSSNT